MQTSSYVKIYLRYIRTSCWFTILRLLLIKFLRWFEDRYSSLKVFTLRLFVEDPSKLGYTVDGLIHGWLTLTVHRSRVMYKHLNYLEQLTDVKDLINHRIWVLKNG